MKKNKQSTESCTQAIALLNEKLGIKVGNSQMLFGSIKILRASHEYFFIYKYEGCMSSRSWFKSLMIEIGLWEPKTQKYFLLIPLFANKVIKVEEKYVTKLTFLNPGDGFEHKGGQVLKFDGKSVIPFFD